MSFDAEQQRRIHLAMSILSSPETIDELGLGQLRDLVAGTLFPGLTVLHTRIRYLVLIPRTYAALQGTTTESVRAAARRADTHLATALFTHYQSLPSGSPGQDAVGIIGRDARLNPDGISRPAGTAFWPLLRSLGIARAKGVRDYCTRVAQLNRDRAAHARFHDDEVPDDAWTLWCELPAEPEEFTGFALTLEEARWLRDLIRHKEKRVPEDRQSAFTYLALRNEWIEGVPSVWDHPRLDDFPTHTRSVVTLAHRADELTYGARILYNLLCARLRPDTGPERDDQISRYTDQLKEWQRTPDVERLRDGRWLDDLDRWVATRGMSTPAHARWSQTSRFLRDWHSVVTAAQLLVSNENAADIVRSRETLLKSSRAKLAHPNLLSGWEGDTGLFHLDYNWGVARRLLGELHLGLGNDIVDGS